MTDLQSSVDTMNAIIAFSAVFFVIVNLLVVLMLFRLSRVIEIGLKLTKEDLRREKPEVAT